MKKYILGLVCISFSISLLAGYPDPEMAAAYQGKGGRSDGLEIEKIRINADEFISRKFTYISKIKNFDSVISEYIMLLSPELQKQIFSKKKTKRTAAKSIKESKCFLLTNESPADSTHDMRIYSDRSEECLRVRIDNRWLLETNVKDFITANGVKGTQQLSNTSGTDTNLDALADQQIVKKCLIDIKVPGDSRIIPTTYEISKIQKGLVAKRYQLVDGVEGRLPDEPVELKEYIVRENLSESTKDQNEAESLIIAASGFLNSPEIGKMFSVGLDLLAIRNATVYSIGKATHMGRSVIVDAKDQYGNSLGSFLTGFFPFACK